MLFFQYMVVHQCIVFCIHVCASFFPDVLKATDKAPAEQCAEGPTENVLSIEPNVDEDYIPFDECEGSSDSDSKCICLKLSVYYEFNII
jgi:hypothetical protein